MHTGPATIGGRSGRRTMTGTRRRGGDDDAGGALGGSEVTTWQPSVIAAKRRPPSPSRRPVPSGWVTLASRRYAWVTSPAVASFESPSVVRAARRRPVSGSATATTSRHTHFLEVAS